MPEDHDFKRLVRRRMGKTGERYTTARAQLRPPTIGSLEAAGRRTGLERLPEHLEATYGIEVRQVAELDLGVFRVDRHDGVPWAVRVFPTVRSIDQVEDDERVLRFVEAHGILAERPAAASAVSVHEGQGVLVTDYVLGNNARHDASGETVFALGSTLGQLHALESVQCPVHRRAGGWHHAVPDGGGVADAAQVLLGELDPADQSQEMRFVRAQLEGIDDLETVPRALIHPDPCGANAIVRSDGQPVLIDWTGSGPGPRIFSLAELLAGSLQPVPGAPASRVLAPIDAIMAAYRAHVGLTADELDALPRAIAGGWIVLGAWMHLRQDVPVKLVAGGIADRLVLAERISNRVRETFDLDDEELTRWFRPRTPVVDPAQTTLF